MKFPLALQPYTIREELKKDYFGSLEKVAQIGFKGIELGPPPEGVTLAEQQEHLNRLGLQVISCGAGAASVNDLEDALDSRLDYLEQAGGQYLMCSSRFDTREEWMQYLQVFNRVGERCRKRGVQFLYHNHHWEFVKFDGEYALDILLSETDPEYVKLELDTYWVKRGGEDPAQYLAKLENRCPLLHIKDMEPGEEQFFAEVSEGILNFPQIAQVAEKVGTKWLVVEQDRSRRPIFESLEISYRNLVKMELIE